MVTFKCVDQDICMTEYYEEIMSEQKNPPHSATVVETVDEQEDDDDDSSYIEIEVSDDEDEDSTAAAPPLPKRPVSASIGILKSNPVPEVASTATAPPPVAVPPASPPLPLHPLTANLSFTGYPSFGTTTAIAKASSPSSPAATTTTKNSPNPHLQGVMLTPSKQRAKAANSAGLSELSKQLRILQAKNEAQAVDINRLERQLRILADLQGISVSDLRKALENACASEAFGELQSRVAKLKFELEAATLAKQTELRNNNSSQHVANLELRVGELEEVEERQQAEIRHLYEQLRYERAKSTRLESENGQFKTELEEMRRRLQQEVAKANQLSTHFQDQMRAFQESQAKKMREELDQARTKLDSMESTAHVSGSGGSARSATASSVAVVSPEMAAEYERMVKLLRERDEQLRVAQAKLNAEEIKWAQKLKEAEEKAREAQMNLKMEMDKLSLTVKELEDADGQSGLRLAQYKARFAVQDERIEDLDQQLNSLYTAFTLLKEEFDSENAKRAAMLSNLNDADAEIARQANKLEKQKSQRATGFSGTSDSYGDASGSAYGSNVSVQSVPRVIATPPSTVMMTPTSSSTPPSTPGRGRDFETPAYAAARPFPHTPERTPSTWQLLFPQDDQLSSKSNNTPLRQGERLIHGPLVVESKGMLRKWKTKHSTIYLRGDHYQWQIGDKRSFPLQFGISKVEFHPNYPLSFVVHLNPFDSMAPVVHAAAVNERDYHRWMAALTKATSGEDYQGGSDFAASRGGHSMGTSSPDYPQPPQYASNTADQEAAELQRILELSRREV